MKDTNELTAVIINKLTNSGVIDKAENAVEAYKSVYGVLSSVSVGKSTREELIPDIDYSVLKEELEDYYKDMFEPSPLGNSGNARAKLLNKLSWILHESDLPEEDKISIFYKVSTEVSKEVSEYIQDVVWYKVEDDFRGNLLIEAMNLANSWNEE